MIKSNMLLILILLILLFTGSLFTVLRVLHSGAPNGELPKTEVILGGKTFKVELAQSTSEKSKGLSGRAGLGENDGMLFIFNSPASQSFWMKDMKFPIDIIWINGDKISGFAENAQPEPGRSLFLLKVYSSPEPVDTVLEVNAGTVANLGLKTGDNVTIRNLQ